MDNLDSTVNKLIILYIFDAIEMPLAEDSIVDICYYDLKCMQYIDCKEQLQIFWTPGLSSTRAARARQLTTLPATDTSV